MANLLYLEILKTLYSYKLQGTLKALWTVLPFSNKVAAIPLVAVEIIRIFLERNKESSLLIKNDLPIPPGPSKKVKPDYLFNTNSEK